MTCNLGYAMRGLNERQQRQVLNSLDHVCAAGADCYVNVRERSDITAAMRSAQSRSIATR